MERYRVIKKLALGHMVMFGKLSTRRMVAIKKMKKKFYSWEECINLREVQECSLYEFTKGRDVPFTEYEIRKLCFQAFQALAYVHQQGYFHRDLKPENLLISKDVIKVADFGLVRDFTSKPPFTEYVSTRWYRAPEVLLHSSIYGPPIDMWAMGAIMAELFNHQPLFPGVTEADEIDKICSVIGSPCQNSWADGLCLANKMKFYFPHYPRIHLSRLIPSASDHALSLISWLCSWDPNRRPTAVQALQHPFFQPCYYIPPSLRMRATEFIKHLLPVHEMKEAFKHRSSCIYCEGHLANGKPANNFSSTTGYNCSRKDDTHKKLDMHRSQDRSMGESFEQNKPLRPWHRPLATKGPGHLGDSNANWNLYKKLPVVSSDRVAELAKRLENLTCDSSS
ncbi:hypothetical protein HPP92_008196 [Vanilla planifolia]|uniref:cyclin-dependent kinase n=1 Tax=Vanilla planifolia TaxID=51239 RepID=A0A835V7P0_VANPL|nr:hypothetical protein HPP92_008196 [Vanilla planifolia]